MFKKLFDNRSNWDSDELLKDEPLGQKLLKKGFWLYFFTFFIGSSSYFTRVIISNDLSLMNVGLFYSVLWFVVILSSYNDLWFTNSLQYFLPKFWINKKVDRIKLVIFSSFFLQLVTGIIIGLLLFFCSDRLAIHYFHSVEVVPLLKIMSIYFFVVNFSQLFIAIFASFQDVFYQKLIEFIKVWWVFLFTIVILFMGVGDLVSYGIVWILSLFIAVIVGFFVVMKKYKPSLLHWKLVWNSSVMKKYMKYALVAFIWTNAWVLLWQIDQQMILYFLWWEQAWYYTNYLSLTMLVWVIVGPLLTFVFPLVSELVSKKSWKEVWNLQNFLYKYFSVFALSFGILLVALWPEIATVMFGLKFKYSGELLLYSWLFVIFWTLFWLNFSIMSGLWKNKERVWVVIIAASVNIILNYLLIPKIWLIWGIISTVLWWVLMFFMSFRVINRIKKIKFDWSFLSKNLVLSSCLWFFIHLIKDTFFVLENAFRYRNILVLIWIGFLFYLILVFVNWKEVSILKNEIKKIRH